MSDTLPLNGEQHARYQDDLAAYALGALDDAAAVQLEDHLAECPACRATLADYQEIARLLPLALPAAQPPPAARDDVLSRAGGATSRGWLPVVLRGTPARVALVALAAVLAVAIGLSLWFATRHDSTMDDPAEVVQQLEQSPDVRVFSMTGSQNSPQAVGQLIMQPNSHEAGLVASGLPELERGHCFQLWFVRPDGTRASGGIFWADEAGGAITLVDVPDDIGNFKTIGVTEEPYPGSPTPTGQSVMRGGI